VGNGTHPSGKGTIDVSSAERAEAPIYDRLVEERGDVLADVRRTAEQTLREVDRAMNFSGVRPAWRPN
jgi:hypothetical protein